MEKENCLISVIIPCYNVGNLIERCIGSLVNQSIGIEKLELIFVDDASTDGTVDVIKKWEKLFPDNILLVTCEENGRQGKARNIGVSYSSTEYIFFVDADDWIDESMLEDAYNLMISTNVDCVIAPAGRDIGNGELVFVDRFNWPGEVYKRNEINSIEERKRIVNYHEVISLRTTGMLYQRKFILENNLCFLEGVAYEDIYFNILMRLCLQSYAQISETYYHYFVNTKSTCFSVKLLSLENRLLVTKATMNECVKRGLFEIYYSELKEMWIEIVCCDLLREIYESDIKPIELLEDIRKETINRFGDSISCSLQSGYTLKDILYLGALEPPQLEEWQEVKSFYFESKREIENRET